MGRDGGGREGSVLLGFLRCDSVLWIRIGGDWGGWEVLILVCI